MVASHQRKLLDGQPYNRFFPVRKLENTNPILLKRGDTFDTINLMEKIIRQYQADTGDMAPLLRGNNLKQTCQNIWEFAYQHFQYKQDADEVEQLRRPLRAWKDRVSGIDCDCYSILISTILLNLGIPHKLRKAKYNGNSYYQHIYVIVPEQLGSKRYYTIDPVVDSFNYETPFTAKFDKLMMPIQLLNGVPATATATGGGYRPGFGAEFLGLGTKLVGLGAVDADPKQQVATVALDFLERLRLHLDNTRLEIRATKTTALYPFAGQIDQVLGVWDNDQERLRLLDAFSQKKLNGFFDSVGDFFGGIKDGVVQAAGWVGDKAGQAGSWAWTGIKNAAEWTGDKLKDAAEFVMKWNPLSILIRNALLLAFKVNLFRMAERLGYGFFSEQQAVSAGLDVAEWRKAKDRLDRVIDVHKGLQGDEDSLRSAIMDGYHHGTTKHGTPRLGEPVSATAGTAAATPVIATVVKWLAEVDWDKLFKLAKQFAPAKDTNYPTVVPASYQAPSSEQEYYANQAKFDNPKPETGNSNGPLILAGLCVAGVIVAAQSE